MGVLHPDILDVVPKRRWYVAVVRNHCERSVKSKLDSLDMGLETYVPMQKVFKVYCDRRKWVDAVAIPGIVFVGAADEAALRSAVILPLALRFLKVPGRKDYAIVPDDEFLRMKDFIERAEEEITLERGLLRKGTVARVFRGPFKGCEVMIVADDSETKARIGIELDILGRTLCTTIQKSDLLSDVEWRRATRRLRESL